ncbi:MAG: sigma 54-interacting transcriptional regulator [Desulfohalobiaceae bacterium]|nr:sigma 54-interacting transcriptional regulator [Desulfohalobiaceae bacterium]
MFEQLHMSGELGLLFDTLPMGLVAVDHRGIIRIFNCEASRLLATPADQALGRSIREVVPNTRIPHVLQSRTRELNQRQIIEDTTILTSRLPILNAEAGLLGAVAVFQDNSEFLRLAEEVTNLRDTRSLLEAVINSTQDAISVVDENGTGIMINPAYTRLTGLSEDQVLNKPATVDIAEGESVHLKVLSQKKPVTGVSMKVGPHRRPVIVDGAPILVGNKLKGSVGVIHDLSEIYRLAEELEKAKRHIRSLETKYCFQDIVGSSPKIRETVEQARRAATTPATVLLQGDSGTGKELFAHAIHEASGRPGQFVRVSCAAIAESLLESELFGHVPGAFTGSSRKVRKGYFETAHKGTLFLDEIGELSFYLQSKLLRVLQEKEIVRVGDSEPISVDTRFIVATNKDLEQEIKQGRFREDLYYRLKVMPIHIPDLNRRKEDIPELADFLLGRINQEYGRNIRGISPRALDILQEYNWPGNVRELENVLRRATISMNIADTQIRPEHLPPLTPPLQLVGLDADLAEQDRPWPNKTLPQMRREWERQMLEKALRKTDGSRSRAAELLGISIRSLHDKLSRYGLR